MRRAFLALAVVAACTPGQAKVVRNLGVGVTEEGGALAVAATVTRDRDEGVEDALLTVSPLLIPGLALWIAGVIASRSVVEPRAPDR